MQPDELLDAASDILSRSTELESALKGVMTALDAGRADAAGAADNIEDIAGALSEMSEDMREVAAALRSTETES